MLTSGNQSYTQVSPSQMTSYNVTRFTLKSFVTTQGYTTHICSNPKELVKLRFIVIAYMDLPNIRSMRESTHICQMPLQFNLRYTVEDILQSYVKFHIKSVLGQYRYTHIIKMVSRESDQRISRQWSIVISPHVVSSESNQGVSLDHGNLFFQAYLFPYSKCIALILDIQKKIGKLAVSQLFPTPMYSITHILCSSQIQGIVPF